MKYELKCNAPKFEQHKGYTFDHSGETLAKSDFKSLQSQFEARGYSVKAFFRNKPLRGSICVEIDSFYYYVELYTKEGEL